MAIYKDTYEEAERTITENWTSNGSKPNLFAHVKIRFGEKYMIDYSERFINPEIEVLEDLIQKIDYICDGEDDKTQEQSTTQAITFKQGDLHSAVESGDLQSVKSLIKSGADTNFNDGRGMPLHAAVALDQPDIIELLLNAGSDINALETFQNATPLHMAVFRNNVSVVKLLVSRGADISIRDSSGNTPRAMAIENGYNDVVKALSPKRWWQFWR